MVASQTASTGRGPPLRKARNSVGLRSPILDIGGNAYEAAVAVPVAIARATSSQG